MTIINKEQIGLNIICQKSFCLIIQHMCDCINNYFDLENAIWDFFKSFMEWSKNIRNFQILLITSTRQHNISGNQQTKCLAKFKTTRSRCILYPGILTNCNARQKCNMIYANRHCIALLGIKPRN